MSKSLEEFTVECHCGGWFHNDRNSPVPPVSVNLGQKFVGSHITERMIRALEGEEDFMTPEGRRQVLSLNTGTAAELRLAFEAAKVEAAAPKTAVKKTAKPRKRRKKKSEEPKRTPRPVEED